jgi:hypothetical protein
MDLKPTVHYTPSKHDIIIVGSGAVITPVDHYNLDTVSNTKMVHTSTVLVHSPLTGEFETRNTKYIPTF